MKRYAPLGLAVLVGLIVRLLPSGFSLCGDDGVSLYYCSRTWSDIVPTMTGSGEPNPPLYFFWLHFWMLLVGPPHQVMSEVWLRLSSIGLGVLTIPVVWALVRDALGEREANVAAFFMAICSFHVWWDEQLRMYPMATLWTALAAWGMWRMSKDGGWLYGLAATLCLYTHYLTGFVLLGLHAIVLLNRDYPWRRLLLVDAAVALLFAPWIPHLLQQASVGTSFQLRQVPPAGFLPELFFELLFGWTIPVPLAGWAGAHPLAPLKWVGLVFPIVAGTVMWKRRSEVATTAALWATSAILVTIAATYAVTELTSIKVFEYQYFCIVTPFIAVLVGWAGGLPGPIRSYQYVLGLLLFGLNFYSLGLLWTDPDMSPQDWRSAAHFVGTQAALGDMMLVQPGMESAIMGFYMSEYRTRVLPAPVDMVPPDSAAVLTQSRRIWFCDLPFHPIASQSNVDAWLRAQGYSPDPSQVMDTSNFFPTSRIHVQLYTR